MSDTSRQEQVRQAIISMMRHLITVQTVWGDVTAVASDHKTCTAKSVKNPDFEYFDVLLSLDPASSGITLVPEVGSRVLLGTIENHKSAMWVMRCEKVDHVKLHGDQYGGLIKIDNLVSEFNTRFNAIKAAVSAGFGALSALDSGASGMAFNTSAQAIAQLTKQSIENQKVKHG